MRLPAPFAHLAAALVAAFLVAAGEGTAERPPPAAEVVPEALDLARRIEADLVASVAKVRRSSVGIVQYRTLRGGPLEGREVPVGCGSGVLVSVRGRTWVLTNDHVVDGAERLGVVGPDGVEIGGVVHDRIAKYDIALVRLEGKIPKGWQDVRVQARTSASQIREGTWVIATGTPFFLGLDGQSVTTLGVVSGVDRVLGSGRWSYVGAVQHDAEVNPGNSGGPLWNLRGDLVGLNGLISAVPRFPGARPSNTGASYALPSEQLDAYLKQLVADDDACAGFLGLQTTTYEDDKGKAAGARIDKVDPRSPLVSAKDGPRVGDVVTHFGAGSSVKRIYTSGDLDQEVSVLCGGTKVSMRYRRGTRLHTWRGELGDVQ